jgi:D-alanyl-lipoteichoic acid acyltransferase DltB (MBOAT superfamily)
MLEPRKIKLDQCYEGGYLIFWGSFKKMFIADNLAQIVDPVFASSGPYNGAIVLLALYAFAFQIYCDFSGYSDIARGLGKCMGFDIMINFNLPYFSTNPSEFWRRWHISLSTWLRDYLYIPLGGNKKGSRLTYRNLALTMLIGGLWHGAQWTFIVWGAYHGLLLIVHRLMSPIFAFFPKIQNRIAQNTWWFIKVFFFFHLVCFGWLFFRAESFTQITAMMQSVIFSFDYSWPTIKPYVIYLSFFIWFLLVIQVLQRYKNNLTILRRFSRPLRFSLYILMFYLIVIWGAFGTKEFIYFQF